MFQLDFTYYTDKLDCHIYFFDFFPTLKPMYNTI